MNKMPVTVASLRAAIVGVIAIGLLTTALSFGAQAQPADPENTLYLDLADGRVVIQMRPDLARKHVRRIKQLVRSGFYDGLEFFRVEWWVAQTGSPSNDGYGNSSYPNLDAEFSSAPFVRGAVGMARSEGAPNSANSQFFFVIDDAPNLNGQYSLWGYVSKGMRYIDGLEPGVPPDDPVKILRLRVAADVVE